MQRLNIAIIWLSLLAASVVSASAASAQSAPDAGSRFITDKMLANLRRNVRTDPWCREAAQTLRSQADYWLAKSDEELWGLMFGPTLSRSWMVDASGFCPSCKQRVPMYTWKIEEREHPWKVICPHCGELFPKNDFGAFYRSGLDVHGVFDPTRANRELLFNAEHPDAGDPLHRYGVDDGEGFSQGNNCWRFIGTYLVYGQWKKQVLQGIIALSQAYTVTGDPAYAHKAAILLDRLADLYPLFDFKQQGWAYGVKGRSNGYLSLWHDSCQETHDLALAYDRIRGALPHDEALVAFLSKQARRYQLDNPKTGGDDIRRNIEERILRDALAHPYKIDSNYPRSEITKAVITGVLGGPDAAAAVRNLVEPLVTRATAVDGVTGEKGLAAYSAYTIAAMAEYLALRTRVEPSFLPDLLARHPQLRQTYRFHIDTRCLGRYYPNIGDSTGFAEPVTNFPSVFLEKDPSVAPSMFTFLWQLYRATGDSAYVQVLYQSNDSTADGLPYDLFVDDPSAFRGEVKRIIAKQGPEIALRSVNKEQWALAILRSGAGAEARALWLDYDTGGGAHAHGDAMNVGLFAKGLDLLADDGYPPVQYEPYKQRGYAFTGAHNTVMVNGKNQTGVWGTAIRGKTTLWADGTQFHAVRAAMQGPTALKPIFGSTPDPRQFERTVALIDLSPQEAYVVDVFRVVGGTEHVRLYQSTFGVVTNTGLNLKGGRGANLGAVVRNFRSDPAPAPGWQVDWRIEDRYHLLPAGADVHLRYTDLTTGGEAWLGEGWVNAGGYNTVAETWIPRLFTRRAGPAPLASTFVAVVEPYTKVSNIQSIRRVPLETPGGASYGDNAVAVEVVMADGRRDLIIAADPVNPLRRRPSPTATAVLVQPQWGVRTDGELCLVRRDATGRTIYAALSRGRSLQAGNVRLTAPSGTAFVEFSPRNGR